MDTSQELYNDLFKLTQENEAFYFVDYGSYRVFNYRLASYTDFLAKNAMEARGIMFYMYSEDKPVLVCRPFKKFFNVNENPMTMNLDFSPENISKVAIKEDGSIISSYIDVTTNALRLKSKQSLVSEQTAMANAVLSLAENLGLKIDTEDLTRAGYTVIFELVSPANRIVLEYPKTELRVLGVRDNVTGDLVPKESCEGYPRVAKAWCEEFDNIDPTTVPGMEGIEGYVYTFKDGTMAKMKTDWYKTLHHLKDSVNATRHLFEAIIDERIDDVRAMFATDEYTMKRIAEMEAKVLPKFNHLVKAVEEYYETHKHLSKKDFAIAGKAKIGQWFHLAIAKYVGQTVDYKTFAKKYYEETFGLSFTNEVPVTE